MAHDREQRAVRTRPYAERERIPGIGIIRRQITHLDVGHFLDDRLAGKLQVLRVVALP